MAGRWLILVPLVAGAVLTAVTADTNEESFNCYLQCSWNDLNGHGNHCVNRTSALEPLDAVDTCCKENTECLRSLPCVYQRAAYVVGCDEGNIMICDANANGGEDSCTNRYCQCKASFITCLNKQLCPEATAPKKRSWFCRWLRIGCKD